MTDTPSVPPDNESWRRNLRGDIDAELDGARPDWWWTGTPPDRCPGVQADGTLTSLRLPDLRRCTRAEVLDYFDNGWTLTEVLFSGLASEASFYRPPYHQLRHPMIFYYCHPAALYINKLRVAGLVDQPLDAYYERLFETGVDEMRWDDMSKNEMLWPGIREVNDYRRQVYRIVRDLIEAHSGLASGHAPITQDDRLWALFMGFEHERIHLETSSVLMRELPLSAVQRPAQWPALHPSARPDSPSRPAAGAAGQAPVLELVAVPGGRVELGKPADWPSYGWDNEYGHRSATVQPFRAGRRLVSNGEFHAFVAGGGYREPRHWSETGWSWRSFRNTKWPTFWVPDGPAGLHRYRLRTMFEEIALPWDWPAEVNWHEARAYCAWLSEKDGLAYRLPSEAEHQTLRDARQRDAAVGAERDPVMVCDGASLARQCGWNTNLAHGSSSPVNAGTPTAAGFHDVFGNVWQWIEDHFNPLPGARVHPYYDDFSTPCYDGQHQMILGGSWASTGDEASIWARFHFRPHFFQHAGFRVVQAAGDGGAVRLDQAGAASRVYEDEQVLGEYLLLHYGSAREQMPYAFGPLDAALFPVRCARWLAEAARERDLPTARALDVGCAVGRATFELARTFREVLGVDLSRAFIDAAQALKQNGTLRHFRKDEGLLGAPATAIVDPAIERSRVAFRQADAGSLPAELVNFDAVLIANLLCRMPSPRSLLGRLGGPRGLVAPGGLLAIFSPYSWLEQFTPRDAWLGGREVDGAPLWSAAALRAQLVAEGFELLREGDEALVIREHARKFQYIVTDATLWRRVA